MENDLIKKENNLPVNLEDIAKFVLIGKERLISVKAEIRAMKNLKVAKDVCKQKEIEAKELGGALLLAKVRIGEMLKEIPKGTPNPKLKNNESSSAATLETKQEKAEELGFSKFDTSRFQQLADNKDIVEKVIEESEDIPTQTECLSKIKSKKNDELKKKRAKLKEQSREPKESKKSEIVFFNCDCFEFLKATKDNTVDCIITDPPYSVTDNSWDNFKSEAAFLKFIDKVLSECKRVLKPNYAFFMFMDSRLMSKVEELIIKNKLDLKSRIIWVRKNMSMGRVVKDRFISQWEICFYCGNKELNFPEVWGEERGDVQEAAVPQTNYEDKKIHPTQKPLKIVERFIELSTNQGDIIIDPFCGGGTTAAACYNLGRHCSTSDISKEYIDNAKERIFGHE